MMPELLDLLAKFAAGVGGRRTGELMRRGFIRVEVTPAGYAELGVVGHDKSQVETEPSQTPGTQAGSGSVSFDPGLSGERPDEQEDEAAADGVGIPRPNGKSSQRSATAGENPAPGTYAVLGAAQVKSWRMNWCHNFCGVPWRLTQGLTQGEAEQLCDSHEALRAKLAEAERRVLDYNILAAQKASLLEENRKLYVKVDRLRAELTEAEATIEHGQAAIQSACDAENAIRAKVTKLEHANWEKYTLLGQNYDQLLAWARETYAELKYVRGSKGISNPIYGSMTDRLESAPAAVKEKACDACEDTGPVLSPHTCNVPWVKP